jgi:hypothetical protein
MIGEPSYSLILVPVIILQGNFFVIDVQQERVQSHIHMTIIIIIKLKIEFR